MTANIGDWDWDLWVLLVAFCLLAAAGGVIAWLWRGRLRCRQAVRQAANEHFVRGTVFCLMHRNMFPEHRVPVGVAFDPNHREERDRALVEWGAFGDPTDFDVGEWEASLADDRRSPYDDPETGRA